MSRKKQTNEEENQNRFERKLLLKAHKKHVRTILIWKLRISCHQFRMGLFWFFLFFFSCFYFSLPSCSLFACCGDCTTIYCFVRLRIFTLTTIWCTQSKKATIKSNFDNSKFGSNKRIVTAIRARLEAATTWAKTSMTRAKYRSHWKYGIDHAFNE